MQLDIQENFGSLYSDDSVKQQLLELQECLRPRKDAQNWAQSLRFITPTAGFDRTAAQLEDDVDNNSGNSCKCSYWATFEDRQDQDTLQVTLPNNFHDCNHYVAVSWVWQGGQPPRSAVDAPNEYYITDDAGVRDCTVPAHILSRAISFAAHYGVAFVWFDKECIDQNDLVDQELGIQSMDIVYQRSLYPLGILQTFIETQEQLDIVTQLIEGIDVVRDDMPIMLDVLQLIEQDRWFTRAWILQESVSGGFEMSLLIQHLPSLTRSPVLGNIAGEIETTISELINAIYFAAACVSLSKETIDPDLEARLNQTIEHILSFMPTVIGKPAKGFDDPDYRQTCNAAQALTYLKPRMNSRIADRIAIMGNLCNYTLRLDTSRVEKMGYGFSICAFALALFNGDLSLTRAENPVAGLTLSYVWGPQRGLRLSGLEYFEDDDDVVRLSPARLGKAGLLVDGWLWKVDKSMTDIQMDDSDSGLGVQLDDPALLIWQLLKRLLREGFFDLADVVWDFTRKFYFGTVRDLIRGPLQIPASLNQVLDYQTGDLVYHDERWTSEHGFRAFFEVIETSDPRSLDYREHKRHWEYNRWFWTLIKEQNLPLATLVNSPPATSLSNDGQISPQNQPTAVFDVLPRGHRDGSEAMDRKIEPRYVFQPATVLDGRLARSQRRNAAIFWIVELANDIDVDTGCRMLRGTGEMCRGYYRISSESKPELFVFS